MKAAAHEMFPMSFCGVRMPDFLAERCRFVHPEDRGPAQTASRKNEAIRTKSRGFVLYWMRTALRTEENPAFDAASLLAIELQLPLLVYHGLSESYQYASDRHHQFILEAAVDVQAAFDQMEVAYAFHLERPGADGDYLRQLSEAATVVVTEDMPLPPASTFLASLASRIQTPILCVDTACVVPMQLTKHAYDRAFEYRKRTEKLYRERMTRPWPVNAARPIRFDLTELPFQTIDLQQASLSELIQECRIDHSVGPVLDTRGGSVAGYQRWNSFLENGLKSYAARRNNALAGGVSRMSAYLHYGMVSPLRIAREAAAIRNEGAEKFLDELLIWRELAYSFCFYSDRPREWAALPMWAQQTLTRHANDPREAIYSWEQLARARTNDPLWNAAQKSLLIHGELHNNVRMTWGKAFLNWAESPQEAMRLAFDLNDRFALDGRDPASVGGILWCFGQFDRPFSPENPIFGTVRTRSTEEHARRLDVVKYGRHTSASRAIQPPHIAVIGAGIAGATAARVLSDHGLIVTVFEKSPGPGGRMATRRVENSRLDHGAPCFTARSKSFRRIVRSWIQQGIVRRWQGLVASPKRVPQSFPEVRYVGVPGMSAVGNHLVQDLDVRFATQVKVVERLDRQFIITDSAGEICGRFDRVIIAVPAPQATQLIDPSEPLYDRLRVVKYDSVWALLVILSRSLPVPWDTFEPDAGSIQRICREQSKPGRGDEPASASDDSGQERLIVHSSADWASEHLEEEPDVVASMMLREVELLLGFELPTPVSATAHRWRYAYPSSTNSMEFPVDGPVGESSLLACGDWQITSAIAPVESAYLSGIAAAGRILRTLNRPRPKNPSNGRLF